MLSEIDKQQILTEISAKLKSAKENKVENAAWSPLYLKACKHAREIEVHSCGHFPDELIGKNFPGETDEERIYRKSSFQPVTKPYFKKALKTLNRIWSEQNYTIDFGDDETKKYFTEDFPIGGGVLNFFKTLVTAQKISEPNGVLVLDFDLPVKETAQGEIVVDDTKEIKPYATVFKAEDVPMFESNAFCLCASQEKSEITYYDRKEKTGFVFYLYDDQYIYRLEQTGKKTDWTFSLTEYYQHALGYLPAWKLKGTTEEVINDEVYYESYFAPALPHLNSAIIIHSTNTCVRNKVSYPIRAYYDQPCTNKECRGGKVWKGEGAEAKEVNCSTCGGTGSMRFSWGRDYVHELPTATSDTGKDQVAFPGISFVGPDGTIIKDNEEVIDKYLSTAFSFLNIEVVNGNQKGLNEPTATKSKIDRDEQYISMLDISNELFQLLLQFLKAAQKVRKTNEEPKIAIVPPVTFDLISSDELSTRLGEAKKSGMPTLAVSEMTVEYMEQEFPQPIARKAKIAQYSDVLFTYETADVSIMQTNKNVQPWQVLLHVNFERYLNGEIEKDKEFLNKELKDIDKVLTDKAKSEAEVLAQGANSADNILKTIAGGGATA